MVNKSNVDIAFDIVSANNGPISFASLWNKLCEELELTQEEAAKKVGSFYTSLLLDGRFINCGDNTWDLRSKYKYDEVSRNIKDVYSDDEVSSDEVEEIEDPEEEIEDEFEEENEDDEKSQYEPDFDSQENY